ncbi:ATP-dependent nuclease [Paracoccus shandongensis]|uniref:ATP-dependent nuclease n=1 Tax=Paracoccus shandongensis TaxID=2816048 RepID=UPI001A8F8952|nr:AAA family ATPase [Paracoccus shandongensis]
MLISFSVSNYKSYYERCTIDFALPANGSNGLTILVGKNNAGKSSIINALAMCFDAKPNVVFDKMDRHNDQDPFIEVKFKFEELKQTLTLKNEARAWYKKILTLDHDGSEVPYETISNYTMPIVAYVPSRRPWEDTFQGGAGAHDIRGFEQQRSSIFEQSRLGNRQLERLGDQLNQIILRGEKDQFDKILKSILPDISDWTTDRVAGQDRIMYVSASGAEHAIRDVGDGVTSVFRLCFALHSYPKNVSIILDEPELSLHPDGQKRLYEVLRKYSKERQIIIATHSPHCIHWPDLTSGTKVYRIAQDEDGHSFAFVASDSVLKDVYNVAHKDFKNRKLFDYLAKEIFFSSSALFVEGQEDVHIISRYLESKGQEDLPLFSYGAGGSPHIIKWVKLSRELGLVVAALYDGDKEGDEETCRKEFSSDGKVLVLLSPCEDIRDKIDEKTGKLLKEGFFTEKWQIKPEREDDFVLILEKLRSHLEDNESKLSRYVSGDSSKIVDFRSLVRADSKL